MHWRNRTRRKQKPESTTVAERLGIGLFSAISSFLLAGLIWWGLSWQLPGPIFPFSLILGFSMLMGVLGTLLKQNLVADLLGALMRALLDLSKW